MVDAVRLDGISGSAVFEMIWGKFFDDFVIYPLDTLWSIFYLSDGSSSSFPKPR